MDSGEPSVITPGTAVMLVWSVGSWDTPCLVRNSNLNCGIWVHTGCLPVNAWLYLLHSTGAIPLSNAYYGSGTGPVLIDYVSCTGNEQFLANCTNRGIGVTSSWCGHDDDAGVQCPGKFTHSEMQQHLIMSLPLWIIMLYQKPCLLSQYQ